MIAIAGARLSPQRYTAPIQIIRAHVKLIYDMIRTASGGDLLVIGLLSGWWRRGFYSGVGGRCQQLREHRPAPKVFRACGRMARFYTGASTIVSASTARRRSARKRVTA